jgi:dihydrofolate synthase/folylpolyglutamate synthase
LFLLRDAHGLPVTDLAIARAFSGISFPARLEVICKDPAVLLDGAHNPHAMTALAEFLRPLGRPVGAFVGMVATKDMASSAAILGPVCSRVYAAGFSYPGAARAETVAAHFSPYCPDTKSFPTPADAIDCARREMKPGDLLLVCGSLYLASEVRPLLLDRFGKTGG